jgi:hypothetical protein
MVELCDDGLRGIVNHKDHRFWQWTPERGRCHFWRVGPRDTVNHWLARDTGGRGVSFPSNVSTRHHGSRGCHFRRAGPSQRPYAQKMPKDKHEGDSSSENSDFDDDSSSSAGSGTEQAASAEKGTPEFVVKRPKNPYLMFASEVRREMESTPNTPPKVIMRVAGERWRKMDDGEKEKYLEMTRVDKERYKRECEKYGVPKQKKRNAGKNGAPRKKRIPSAYILFSQSERGTVLAEHPDWKPTVVTAEIGRRWKALDEKGREPYTVMREKLVEMREDEEKI